MFNSINNVSSFFYKTTKNINCINKQYHHNNIVFFCKNYFILNQSYLDCFDNCNFYFARILNVFAKRFNVYTKSNFIEYYPLNNNHLYFNYCEQNNNYLKSN